MPTTVSNVQEALRYAYGASQVKYVMNEEIVMFNILGTKKEDVGGRGQFIIPLWTQNPGAFTGIAEGGALPTPLAPDTAEATFSLQEYVATYDVTWKLIQDARSNKFAFERALKMLDTGLRRRVMRNLNSDLLGTGRGELCTLPAADDQTTVTVAAVPRLEKGMVVDVMDDTDDDTKLGDSLTVTAVDVINKTVTLSGAPSGTAADDYMVIQDTCDDSLNDSLHSNGILGVVNSSNPDSVVGNIGGINRSTAGNEFWEPVHLTNSGTNRALTEDLMLQIQDGVRIKGGGTGNKWITNQAITRRYHEQLRSEAFFAMQGMPKAIGGGLGRTKKDPGSTGKSPYNFGGIDWHVEPYFTANEVVLLDTSHFFLGVGQNDVPRPMSEIDDRATFFRQTSNATWEVVWYYQMELLTDNPAAAGRIGDVAET